MDLGVETVILCSPPSSPATSCSFVWLIIQDIPGVGVGGLGQARPVKKKKKNLKTENGQILKYCLWILETMH